MREEKGAKMSISFFFFNNLIKKCKIIESENKRIKNIIQKNGKK